MRKLITTTALLVLMAGPAAFAQSRGAGSSTGAANSGGSSSSAEPRTSAPVGHRQPRPSDLPPTSASNEQRQIDAEDAALDRKIKGICRGC